MSHELSTASLIKLISFLLWNWMYFLTVEYAPNKNPEWCSRVITLIHASVAIAGGLTQCKWRELTPWHLTRRLLPCQYMLMVWSWGYFAFDLLWCLIYNESFTMLCHHSAALVAITRYMQKQHTGCTFACTLVLLELTNPFLQIRWFLKHEGYGNSYLYFAVEVTYLLLFLILRGLLGTYLIFEIFRTDYFDWEGRILSVIFYVVSMAFVYDIAGYIRYKYKNEIDEFRQFYYATQIPNNWDRSNQLTQAEILDTL
ncbi:TLC domain-containing protein 5-like [Helicoverpa zea]|uniref:TLC domain-containing protein 5-like n=1 Tax=Helicoverpa zea TaxID=7113 RepID=UPI001F574981|nr:TLC domain-containing protein 5-like [Helicoverpa zea]